tara:strand:+ start:938 stop:1153 length:216 start_codon:yes stop_codon:yes gene_type:complete
MEDSSIRILQGKPNKSDFVNLAVHKFHSKEMHFDISNVSMKALFVEIVHRMPFDDPMRLLLVERINKLSTS